MCLEGGDPDRCCTRLLPIDGLKSFKTRRLGSPCRHWACQESHPVRHSPLPAPGRMLHPGVGHWRLRVVVAVAALGIGQHGPQRLEHPDPRLVVQALLGAQGVNEREDAGVRAVGEAREVT